MKVYLKKLEKLDMIGIIRITNKIKNLIRLIYQIADR